MSFVFLFIDCPITKKLAAIQDTLLYSNAMTNITGYHAHIYFDKDSIEKAKLIANQISEKFDLSLGRFHEKLVGPHPRWSVQLAFNKNKLGRVIPWLMKNRDGLTVFVHPETGDDLKDHTDHALWMGEMLELNLDLFTS